jgi:hypothetical protein
MELVFYPVKPINPVKFISLTIAIPIALMMLFGMG